MNWQDVKSIEDFFEWLPTFMCHKDTLHCEEDLQGNMTYMLRNQTQGIVLTYNSKQQKITRYD